MRFPILSAALVAVTLCAPARSQEATPRLPVPRYELPGGLRPPALVPELLQAARDAVHVLRDPPGPEDAQEAARLLAGLGAGALPPVIEGLRGAPWYARASLVSAIAEMDAPAATPVLAAAARDPSFAVRTAAVTGLGKTGDSAGSGGLFERADPAHEPVWRVRAATAAALRRAVLRGSVPRERGEATLARLLADPDPDVRRAALLEVVPLAAPTALPRLLEVYADAGTTRDDRELALAALRTYRERPPELLEALRRGLTETDDPEAAAQAGAALLDLSGATILHDPDISRAVLRQLGDAGAPHLREALARLGRGASDWLGAEARRLAGRVAQRRVEHQDTPLEALVEIQLRVHREAAFGVLRDLVVGPEAEVMDPETRRFALRKVALLFAPRLAKELRALFDSHAGDGVRRQLLLAIEQSGGDDLAERLDAALRHPDREARSVARELLEKRFDLPAGPELRRIASAEDAAPHEREHALEVLSRRDEAEAATVAIGLLDDPRADVREKAIAVVDRAKDAAHYEALLRRLEKEDGADVPPRTSAPDAGPVATTPSVAGSRQAARARRLRRALVGALIDAGGERAREPLLRVVEHDPDPFVREKAISQFGRLARDSDAALLLRFLAAETGQAARQQLLEALARLGGSDTARAHFDALVAEPGRRHEALVILRQPNARVLPAGLATALAERAWNDEELEAALVLLARSGRTPPPAELADIVRDAQTNEFARAAAVLLADAGSADAKSELVELLRTLDDADKLAAVAEQTGRVRIAEALPELVRLLETRRAGARAARRSTNSDLNLYRRAAVSLGRIGSDAAGRVLVRHLLGPRLARLGARLSAARNGPFKPVKSAPARMIRGLVCALAHLDDETARRLLGERLAEMRRSGADLRLDEGYADGLARYLRNPAAYNLPHRRRPGTALLLQEMVTRIAPRLTALDLEMQGLIAAQLEGESRFAEALVAHRERVRLADVENAGRPPSERVEEAAKERVLEALALAAAGDPERALATAARVRELDPSSSGVAYLHGYALLKLGRAGEDAAESLRFAIAGDERNPRAHLYLGWVVETTDSAPRSLTHYERALDLDRKRVEEAGGGYLTHRRGKVHPRAWYPYWYARALARSGDDGLARELVQAAVRQDDRYGARTLRDPAFAAWDDAAALAAAAIDRIPDSD